MYDKKLYDRIGLFYKLFPLHQAILKFKGSDKEYIFKNYKTADPKVIFCTDRDTQLGTFAKDITKIVSINRKPVNFDWSTTQIKEMKQKTLSESYSKENIKDILWNHFKETSKNIIFVGDDNQYKFEVYPENNMTIDQANDLVGELEESNFFDCSYDGSKFLITYQGPVENNYQPSISGYSDQEELLEKVKQLEHLTNKKIVLESDTTTGEYTTAQMDSFMNALLPIVEWGSELNKGVHIVIPGNYPSSSVARSLSSAQQNWEYAKKYYNKDNSAKWYVWQANIGGTVNQPKKLANQRYDIMSILDIVKRYPESYRDLSVGVENNFTKQINVNTQGD